LNFWDTSAFIEAHDRLSPVFVRALGLLRQKTLQAASALIQPEAIATMTRRLKPDDAAVDAACDLIRNSLAHLDLLAVDGAVLESSMEIARRTGLKGSDSIHLATALIAAREMGRRSFVFLTLDRAMGTAARNRGLRVVLG